MSMRRLPVRLAVAFCAAGLAAVAGAAPAVAGPVPTVAGPADPPVPPPTQGFCGYQPTPADPPARPVRLPRDPAVVPATGTAKVRLATADGPITLTLDRAKAPCTVQSFLHLVRQGFYDRTRCHRLTAYPILSVLQCGDPSGTGEGGPGYKFRDELPVGLPDAPTDPTGARKVYARGVLAMANAGPATNGSQFFMVYKDSALRPDYTIFGTVRADGLAALDKVAAAGIVPTADNPAPVDGAPKATADIRRARLICC
ncbi:peptidylprolyl isomerase [Pilimelia columellifera]|uniref:Peptidyl-prolyl cis-trans isomerase n=1 Tax=Pilimelia columellifera subsp. columellifera TaxID=706583 RepID=A0ABP6A4K3_9ACTN